MNLKVEDKCSETFQDLKFHKKTRYIIYKIDNQVIVVEKVGEKNQNWEQLMANLPENQFRYCVFDLQWKNEDNMEKSKLIFVYWCPDQAPLKHRGLYASAKESFKGNYLEGVKEHAISARNEYTMAEIIKENDK